MINTINNQYCLRFRSGGRRRSRGSVLVETVLGVIILSIFMFAIVESGWYFRDASVLNTVARDYARYISTGMTTTQAMREIENSNQVTDTGLLLQNGLSDSNFSAYYSTDGVTFPTTQPVVNDTSGGKNSVVSGNLIMVTVTYSHSRITGLFGSGQTPMRAVSVMVRQ